MMYTYMSAVLGSISDPIGQGESGAGSVPIGSNGIGANCRHLPGLVCKVAACSNISLYSCGTVLVLVLVLVESRICACTCTCPW